MTAQLPLRALLYVSVAFAVSTPAYAQEVFELDTVYLGESKREVQTDTATAETVIDEEEIKDRQAGTIAELMDSVPGVNLVNGATPTGSGINIRGFGANGTYGTDQKVGIQVNGASVGSEELYRIGTQLFTDPALYKEVNVIRGMAGTYEFGSGLIGGLVQLDTIDADDLTNGETGFALRETLQYGTNGNQVATSTILAWQPSENFGVIGNYTYRWGEDMVDGAGNSLGTNGTSLPSWMVGAKYSFGDANEHMLRFTYEDTQTDETDVPYDTFGTTGGSFGNVDRQTHSRTGALTYSYDSVSTDLINLTATLSYADQQIDQEYVAGSSVCENFGCGFPFPDGGFGVVNADHRYQTTKLLVKNQALFSTGAIDHDFRFGIEGTYKKRLEASSAPGGTDMRYAAFAVDDMTFGGLTLTPAARFEYQQIGSPDYADYTNSALMGAVTARYEFGSSGFAVFGSAAYNENLPILDDLSTAEYMTQSEKATTYEAGFSFARGSLLTDGDDLNLKVNAYRTNVWDVTSYSGIETVQLSGVEVEGSYSLASGFYTDVSANFAYGSATGENAADVWSGIPASQIRATVGKKIGQEWDVSWEGVYDLALGDTTSSFVHNVRATYRPQDGLFEGAEMRLGVENLLDLEYTPHLATRTAPGRTVKFTLSKTF